MKTILAIESAIRGGSVSILREGKLAGFAVGNGGASRAEDLLPVIERLIGNTVGSKTSLDAVAISVGPGSFTGLRIGIATALGLKNSLSLECIGVALLEAMTAKAAYGRIAAVVPIGKSDVCYQIFSRSATGIGSLTEPTAINSAGLPELLSEIDIDEVVIHDDLLDDAPFSVNVRVTCSGSNLSEVIGLAAFDGVAVRPLDPIYVQSPRFG